MKKPITFATLFLIMLLVIAFNKIDTKEKITHYFYISEKLGKIYSLNNNLDQFTKNILHYNNYDEVEKDIAQLRENLDFILMNNSLQDTNFQEQLKKLQRNIEKKILIIQKIKSYNAILNNSFRYIQKLKYSVQKREFIELYFTLSVLDKSGDIEYDKYLQKIETYRSDNSDEELFLAHSRILLNYFKATLNILEEEKELDILNQLNQIILSYDLISYNSINKAHILVVILFILLILSVFLYLLDTYKIVTRQRDLKKFRSTIENSDNIIIITDKYENIKFTNKAFMKSYGYSFEEVKGKRPSILKSGEHDERFYQELHDTIHSGKKWIGTFINVNKKGEKQYEKASITPIFDDNGDIEEFVAIKLNITKEIETQQALRESEHIMMQQSKMASMGEMLSNIAHQWRQPLSIISTVASGIKLKKEYGELEDEELLKSMNNIDDSVQFLSKTIDDFSNYFKPDKQKTIFHTKELIERSLKILNATLKNNEIEVILDIEDFEMLELDGELMQVIINMINNANDALREKNGDKKLIKIEVKKENDQVVFSVHDNALGVPVEIKEKIFEPYFTTKHQSQGTGIGLYMSHQIITKHMKGIILVENQPFYHKGVKYFGAKFIVRIPLK